MGGGRPKRSVGLLLPKNYPGVPLLDNNQGNENRKNKKPLIFI